MIGNLVGKKPMNTYSPYHERLRVLMREEAKVGATLFGHLPANSTREFFMLDSNTWIWHEEWEDEHGQHVVTTRYEIHGVRLVKIQNHGPAQQVRGHELDNFYQAVMAYYHQVAEKVYNRPIQRTRT